MDITYLVLWHHIISKNIGIEFNELKIVRSSWNLSKNNFKNV